MTDPRTDEEKYQDVVDDKLRADAEDAEESYRQDLYEKEGLIDGELKVRQ